MKKSSKQSYQKAIELGKEWMKESRDPIHDYLHIVNVEKISLEVFKELKRNDYPGIDSLNNELVSITAWWHDCYKATLTDFSLAANFREGEESAKIARKELHNLLNRNELEMVLEAIEGHAGTDLTPYFLLNRTRSPLHKILLEADAHDQPDIPRLERRVPQFGTFIQILWGLVDILECLMLPLYLRTKATRKNLFPRMWRYWGAWLWNEKYLFKAIREYMDTIR